MFRSGAEGVRRRPRPGWAAGLAGVVGLAWATAVPAAAPAPPGGGPGADYEVSGVLPQGFEPRAGARGEAVFFPVKGDVPLARREILTDAGGAFRLVLPATEAFKGGLRVEARVFSDTHAPACGSGRLPPGKPLALVFSPPVRKQDAVHYTGVFVDEGGTQPVPHVGIYSDANGKVVYGRADENGRFDFYVEAKEGRTYFLPWLYGGEFTGHGRVLFHRGGEHVELKLVVERGVRMKVHAEDPNGAPLAGVYVRWGGAGGGGGVTDDKGDVVLSGKASRVRMGEIVEVSKKGYEPVENPGALLATRYTNAPLRLVLRPVATPTGGSAPATGSTANAGHSEWYRASVRKQVEERYRDFLEEARLPPESAARFVELEVEQALPLILPTAAAGASPPAVPKAPSDLVREKFEALDGQIRALLGEEGSARLREYHQSLPSRARVRAFREKMAGTAAEVAPELARQLLAAFLEEHARPSTVVVDPERPAASLAVIRADLEDRILARARAFLSPDQHAALGVFFQEQRRLEQAATGVLKEEVLSAPGK